MKLFSYLDGREITLAEDTDEVQEFMRSWSSSQERRKASQRTRDALRAEMGCVAGRRVYGYAHVREGSMVKRVIDDAEATIVRRIFDKVAQGWGIRRIVMALKAEGVPYRVGRSWAVTTVREMLNQELYRGGASIYGKTKIVRRGGTKRKAPAPAADMIAVPQPALRIVDDGLWDAAHDRLARTRRAHPGHRKADGTLQGRPESVLVSRHLLAGHLRCGVCGGGMFVAPRKATVYYLCTNYWKQGTKR